MGWGEAELLIFYNSTLGTVSFLLQPDRPDGSSKTMFFFATVAGNNAWFLMQLAEFLALLKKKERTFLRKTTFVCRDCSCTKSFLSDVCRATRPSGCTHANQRRLWLYARRDDVTHVPKSAENLKNFTLLRTSRRPFDSAFISVIADSERNLPPLTNPLFIVTLTAWTFRNVKTPRRRYDEVFCKGASV